MPKSRWTALKDKIINVPVQAEDILNTMTQLPRTPNEAGLIEVDLKRKIEYENSHKKQIVNPKKCFKMLELLRSSKNRYYQFYDHRCKSQSLKLYMMVFDENVYSIKDIDTEEEEQEANVDEVLENEYITKLQ